MPRRAATRVGAGGSSMARGVNLDWATLGQEIRKLHAEGVDAANIPKELWDRLHIKVGPTTTRDFMVKEGMIEPKPKPKPVVMGDVLETTTPLPFHPQADLFPIMMGQAYQDLK